MGDTTALDRAAVTRVLRRASELSELYPDDAGDVDVIDERALVAAATEVGITADAVRRAIAVERLGPAPATHLGDRLVGAGTVVKWKLQATKSRSRVVQSNVDIAGHTVIEKDANSSMVTNWTVAPAGPGSSVTVKTSWKGAGGIGGFFEKTFAPIGLRRIYDGVLDKLAEEVRGQ